MSPINIIIFCIGLVIANKDEKIHRRSKRDISDLCGMIQTQTRIPCVRLIVYGNYCGPFNNRGPITDSVDRCCYHHDVCTESTRNGCGTPLIGAVFGTYQWRYHNNGILTCEASNGPCARTQCECDRHFAMCLGFATRRVPIINTPPMPPLMSPTPAPTPAPPTPAPPAPAPTGPDTPLTDEQITAAIRGRLGIGNRIGGGMGPGIGNIIRGGIGPGAGNIIGGGGMGPRAGNIIGGGGMGPRAGNIIGGGGMGPGAGNVIRPGPGNGGIGGFLRRILPSFILPF